MCQEMRLWTGWRVVRSGEVLKMCHRCELARDGRAPRDLPPRYPPPPARRREHAAAGEDHRSATGRDAPEAPLSGRNTEYDPRERAASGEQQRRERRAS